MKSILQRSRGGAVYHLESSGSVFMPGMIEYLRGEKEHDEGAALRALIEMLPTVPAKHVLRILDRDCEERVEGDTLVVTLRD